ncbi:MAG: DUF1592 domain-containing protein [Pseudomonadota bacterium]
MANFRGEGDRSRANIVGSTCMFAIALVAAAMAGCVGQVNPMAGGGAGPASGSGGGDAGADGSGGTGGDVTGGGGVGSGGAGPVTGTGGGTFGSCQPGATLEPGIAPLVKLTTIEYRNTVRDLLASSGLGTLATEIAPALAGVPDDSTITFRGLDGRVSSNHIQSYFNVAAAVGNALESTPALLTAAAGACAMTAPLTTACVDAFLGGFGRRAFRRPLTTDELTSFRALNDGKRTPAEAIRAMVVVLLMSPRFVNQLEIEGAAIGGRADYFTLAPFELASRLSYTFWQTMPDEALLAAAANGSLATDAGFAAQLDRVFADPRTHDTTWQFWNEWFRLESFTGFSAERPAFKSLAMGESLGVAGHDHYRDMVQEVRDLTDLFTWGRKGTLADLLTSNLSVTRSADLARLYGVPAWSGTGAYPVFPATAPRAGILQRGALLVSSLEQTNPFHRGSFVRRSILCDPLPRPDPNSLPPGSLDPPPPVATETTRQRFAKKVDGNALCEGCHRQFSDIGYVMESFDALGRYRTTEKVFDEQTGALLRELPIDANATARIALDDATPVMGVADMNNRIVQSHKVEACMSGNYFRFALRREPTANSGDACLREELAAELAKPTVGLADVFKRLAQHMSFRQRKIGAP